MRSPEKEERRHRDRSRSRDRRAQSHDRSERDDVSREDNHKESPRDNGHDTSHNTTNEGDSGKKHKKEKKAKKAKKKNKKKDRDSEEEEEEEDKENKKKKKKEKRKKSESADRDDKSDVGEELQYPENEETPSLKEEIKDENLDSKPPQPDPSKFINSFSEAVVEEKKPIVSLPTLVFNDKTTELAPRDKVESDNVEDIPPAPEELDDDLLETGLNKWDKDEFYEETKSLESAPLQDAPGPQSLLRKALSNMEKDNVKDRKRKSLDGESDGRTEEKDVKKKKKKKKASSEDESSHDEETKEKTKKKSKKKKKGLDLDEKTLKKMLKHNLLKKKALEKILEDGTSKKKKKKRKSGDLSENEDGKLNGHEENRVIRRKSDSTEPSLKQRKRNESEENREVKSSREGNLQIRVENSTGSKPKKLLTSSIEAKISNGGRNYDRSSPMRKSIKDRLGPVSEKSKSPSSRKGREDDFKRDTIRDRLGRKEDRDGKLKELPSELKAWASKTSLRKDDRGRSSRSRSRDRAGAASNRRSDSKSKDLRRSRSRDRRRKRSLSPCKRKVSKSDRSPVKRRKNERLANNKDRSFNSDSD